MRATSCTSFSEKDATRTPRRASLTASFGDVILPQLAARYEGTRYDAVGENPADAVGNRVFGGCSHVL
jgi:hypothetical protein